MNAYYPHLFEPLTIRKTTFRNRILSTPNASRYYINGRPSESEIRYYEAKSKGGAAQVSVGETGVTKMFFRENPGYEMQLTEERMPAIAELAMAINIHGAVSSIQLNHQGIGAHAVMRPDGTFPVMSPVADGRKDEAPYMRFIMPDTTVFGPSDGVREDGVKIVGLSEEGIQEVIDQFTRAAAFCKRAGFRMIQLHAGHGWLISQFMNPFVNTRKDRWGGSLENRARLTLEILDAIRGVVGPDFPIEMRIAGDELSTRGIHLNEVLEYAKLCDDKVDIINVSAGLHEDPLTHVRMFPHTGYTEHGVNVYLAAAVKRVVRHARISCIGGISYPEHAERILAEGLVDFVGFGRALLADPEMPNKARAGNRSAIIPCLRCSECLDNLGIGNSLACAVNPRTAREQAWQLLPAPRASQKVVVVGGGPGGMEAAITAAERGHQVVLFEKEPMLGGLLAFAQYDPAKKDLDRYRQFLINRTLALAEVRLNTAATPELVKMEDPDVLMLSSGGRRTRLRIPGYDPARVTDAIDAYRCPDAVGQDVLIIGGGLVGCECALFFARKLRNVTLLEMRDHIGEPDYYQHHYPMLGEMEKHPNLQVMVNTKCIAMNPQGIEAETPDGHKMLRADTVIVAVGMQSDPQTIRGFNDCAPRVELIGDVVKPGKIIDAVRRAYYASMSII